MARSIACWLLGREAIAGIFCRGYQRAERENLAALARRIDYLCQPTLGNLEWIIQT